MRVDVIARMASSFAASGRTPVEPVMRFAIQNSSWWEQEHKMLEIKEFKDSSVTDNFHESFLGVVQHSLGEFFDDTIVRRLVIEKTYGTEARTTVRIQ